MTLLVYGSANVAEVGERLFLPRRAPPKPNRPPGICDKTWTPGALPRDGGSSFRGLPMSLVDIPEARPNGSAGPPVMAPLDRQVLRSPIRAYPLAVRQRTKALYEGTTRTIDDIAKEVGVGRTTVNGWAQQDHWVRAAGAPPPRTKIGPDRRKRLMDRLFHAYGRQLATLEKRAGKGDTTDEKDARTLSVLAKTLETLIALDRDDGAKTAEPGPADRERYNAELARRIKEWAERGE